MEERWQSSILHLPFSDHYDTLPLAILSLVRAAVGRAGDLTAWRQPVSDRVGLVGAGENRIGRGDGRGVHLRVCADATVPARRRRRGRPLSAPANHADLRRAARRDRGARRIVGGDRTPGALAHLPRQHSVWARGCVLPAGIFGSDAGSRAARGAGKRKFAHQPQRPDDRHHRAGAWGGDDQARRARQWYLRSMR